MKSTQEKYLPEFVYGATDGLVTTFAIVSGVMGAALSPVIVLILGFANVLADGFSMGASNYLASKSELDLEKKNNQVSVKTKSPLKTGIATFSAFVVVGVIPLIPFVFGYFLNTDSTSLFYQSIGITVIVFFVIGLFRGFIAHVPPIKTAFETLFVGTLAAIISYVVGALLQGLH